MKLRVAIVQMEVGLDVRENVEVIRAAIRRAAEEKADILLTPEGSLSGYTPTFEAAAVAEGLATVTDDARRLQVGLGLGTCFLEADGKVYNQLRFYSPQGEYLGFHSKILRCGTLSEPSQGEIQHYAATPLRVFSFAGIPIGGLICNDLWANPGCTPMPDPHLSQQLAGMGARIIFHAVNGGRNDSSWSRETVFHFHESNLRMRANAGGVWIATVDNCAPPSLPCSAPGGVVDPRGEWACRCARQGTDFVTYTIDL